ncbi:MAG: permease-like cell division protein FtsX [Ignavibacteriaceae bacterium]|jgi:cell division transport system permease protein|nr:permease-like cell division protein FtsX [Ignavibacteriaceae bacterium]
MILFLIKEAIRSNRRAKLSFLFSLSSTTVGLLLIAISLLSVQISHSIEAYLQNQFEVQVYLKDGLTEVQQENLKSNLEKLKNVQSIEFVSKEKAAEKFVKETGEDFRTILDYNPLPASFIVKTASGGNINFSSLLKSIKKFKEVDDAVFPNAIYEKMLFYLKTFQKYIAGLGIVLSIIAFYVIFSTIRLIIESRKEEIETMKLVGGSLFTIKFPLLFNGMIIGFVSGFLAISILYASEIFVRIYFFSQVPHLMNNTFVLLLLGPALGLVSSFFASWKISLKL